MLSIRPSPRTTRGRNRCQRTHGARTDRELAYIEVRFDQVEDQIPVTTTEILNDGDEMTEQLERSSVRFFGDSLVACDPFLDRLHEEHSPLLREEDDRGIGRRSNGENLAQEW